MAVLKTENTKRYLPILKKGLVLALLLLPIVSCSKKPEAAVLTPTASESNPLENYEFVGDKELESCKANLETLAAACESYKSYKGHYPKDDTELAKLVPDVIESLPLCPAAENRSYTYNGAGGTLDPGDSEEYFEFRCEGGNHYDMGLIDGFPSYTSAEGIIEI